MGSRTIICAMGLLALPWRAWTQQVETRGPAAEEIARLLEVHRADYLRGDADAWAALYAVDATFVGDTVSGGERNLQSRQAIRDYFAQVFKDFPTRTANVSNVRIRIYNEGAMPTAIINIENSAQRTDVTGRRLDSHLHESLTWVKIQGKWLIVNHHFSSKG